MTLAEQERRAYADGDTRIATLLASLIDADVYQRELEKLQCRAQSGSSKKRTVADARKVGTRGPQTRAY